MAAGAICAEGRGGPAAPLPVQKPTSIIFGGADLRTLYVTSAIWDLSGPALERQPLAGLLLAFDPGVIGLAETLFAGQSDAMAASDGIDPDIARPRTLQDTMLERLARDIVKGRHAEGAYLPTETDIAKDFAV